MDGSRGCLLSARDSAIFRSRTSRLLKTRSPSTALRTNEKELMSLNFFPFMLRYSKAFRTFLQQPTSAYTGLPTTLLRPRKANGFSSVSNPSTGALTVAVGNFLIRCTERSSLFSRSLSSVVDRPPLELSLMDLLHRARGRSIRPKATETPCRPIPTLGKAAAKTALPHPPSTNHKVPINSAVSRLDRAMSISY